jgi:ketosteroid isomerase-like protein
MKNTRTILCSLGALCLAAYSQTAGRPADLQALKDNEARWNQEFVAKDLEKLVAHYAENAVLMAPGMASVSGRGEIRKTLQEMMGDPALSLKFQASRVEVSSSGDLGFTQGSYRMTMTDPASKQIVHDRGSYVTTYRKQPDGSWKAVADIASSEAAPWASSASKQK